MQQMAPSNTILQTIVDDEKRGRVMAFYSMAFLGMAPFGSLLAGNLGGAHRRAGNDDGGWRGLSAGQCFVRAQTAGDPAKLCGPSMQAWASFRNRSLQSDDVRRRRG